ncbi:E3 SUMO-protein ligase RNF212-like protein [Platysternon megacephalum]|uniref:E3 SUMO-protein ligase RNF212-like protein n=1 Tax=Platysternon megacephalum TaxID=55544 RepID=A0A4D9EHV2_9SAUR|nr:E3 SUMO-protein ligase RNF212-like protein [Platysternon megacephalum]
MRLLGLLDPVIQTHVDSGPGKGAGARGSGQNYTVTPKIGEPPLPRGGGGMACPDPGPGLARLLLRPQVPRQAAKLPLSLCAPEAGPRPCEAASNPSLAHRAWLTFPQPGDAACLPFALASWPPAPTPCR